MWNDYFFDHSGFFNFMFLSDEGPTLKTLDFASYIGGTPTYFYFDSF